MKWIKASDRLPAKGEYIIRKNGKRHIALYYPQQGFRFQHNGAIAKNPLDYEWLEEYTEPNQEIERLQSQLAEAREALGDALIELGAAKKMYEGISAKYPETKPSCDILIEGIDAVISKSATLK